MKDTTVKMRLIFCQDDQAHLFSVLDDGQASRPECGAKVMTKVPLIPAKSSVTMPVCGKCVHDMAKSRGMTVEQIGELISSGQVSAS